MLGPGTTNAACQSAVQRGELVQPDDITVTHSTCSEGCGRAAARVGGVGPGGGRWDRVFKNPGGLPALAHTETRESLRCRNGWQ